MFTNIPSKNICHKLGVGLRTKQIFKTGQNRASPAWVKFDQQNLPQ